MKNLSLFLNISLISLSSSRSDWHLSHWPSLPWIFQGSHDKGLMINKLRPEQNMWQFADDNFFDEDVCFFIQVSWTVVPKSPADNKSTLDQVMAWHLADAKPLPETMVAQFTDACMHHWASMSWCRIYDLKINIAFWNVLECSLL